MGTNRGHKHMSMISVSANLIILSKAEKRTVLCFLSQSYTLNIWFTKWKPLKFIASKHLKGMNIWLMTRRPTCLDLQSFQPRPQGTQWHVKCVCFLRASCLWKYAYFFPMRSRFCFFKSFSGKQSLKRNIIQNH